MPFQSITKIFHVAPPFSLMFLGCPPSKAVFFRMPPPQKKKNPTSPPSLVKNERTPKCVYNSAPDLLRNYSVSSHRIIILLGVDLLTPKVRTESGKNGCFYSGAQAFNNFPPHLKEVKSLVVFKTKLKYLFLERFNNLII